jgi:hypothetical protein
MGSLLDADRPTRGVLFPCRITFFALDADRAAVTQNKNAVAAEAAKVKQVHLQASRFSRDA